MMSTIALLALVIVIEAVPITGYLQAIQNDIPVTVDGKMILAFGLVVATCVAATIIPNRVGLRKMEEFEF